MSEFDISPRKRTPPALLIKEINIIREKIVSKINEINSVANVQGKGRDDFSIETLLKAEEINKKSNISPSVKKLAE